MKSNNLKMMITTALFAAIIGILAQVTIPLPLVPITGQTLAIGLAATILGANYGVIAVGIYLLLGAIGVPVFAEFSAGFSVLVGPTGGYLWSFLPTVWVIGKYMERRGYTTVNGIVANLLGMVITLVLGTVFLKFAANLSWEGAFLGGIAPFIIPGILKAVLATVIGLAVRNRLVSAKLLETKNVA